MNIEDAKQGIDSMRLEKQKMVDSMQIEMSNAAAQKELLLSINLQTVPTTTTVTEKGWSGLQRSGNWCWSRCCNWRDY
jgi:hypothetical protein